MPPPGGGWRLPTRSLSEALCPLVEADGEPTPLAQAGLASRRRASTTRSESVLAAESGVNLMAACCRGSPTLDRAVGRDATTPVAGCRTAGAALVADVSLLPRSWHGPSRRPHGRGWRAPTRSLSETRRAPGFAGGWPVQAWGGSGTMLDSMSTILLAPAPIRLGPRAAARSPTALVAGFSSSVCLSSCVCASPARPRSSALRRGPRESTISGSLQDSPSRRWARNAWRSTTW